MSSRIQRLAAIAGGGGLAVAVLLNTGFESAFAADELQVSVTSQTGTPDFDETAGPGNDVGPNDVIIRTNDQAIYTVQVATGNKPLPGAAITLTIPKGQELRDIPAFCKDVTNPNLVAKPTPALKPPAVPLTADSWKSLPQQSITCAVGDLAANLTQSFQFPAFQRSEVPNGTTLTAATALVKGTDIAAVSGTDSREMVVSAKPRWDLSKNGVAVAENSGPISGLVTAACTFDKTQACYSYSFPIVISGVNSGKGQTPFVGPVTFKDLLNPASFYGDKVVESAKWKAAGTDANKLYAPRLKSCVRNSLNFRTPSPKLGDPKNSVRDSGMITCSQTAPGEDARVSIVDADWSLRLIQNAVCGLLLIWRNLRPRTALMVVVNVSMGRR